jgi:hypothetical protein
MAQNAVNQIRFSERLHVGGVHDADCDVRPSARAMEVTDDVTRMTIELIHGWSWARPRRAPP